ncbi:MAG TPA: response regulator [Candidatus Binataceae bacterium]|nr:response regulator [Candidatus Binataceae bacterium]
MEKPRNDYRGAESAGSVDLLSTDVSEPGFAPSKTVAHPRFYALQVDYVLQVLRVTGVAIVGYQLLFLACDYLTVSRADRIMIADYLLNAISGLALAGATFANKPFCERHWRGIVSATCIVVILSVGLAGLREHSAESVMMVVVLLLAASGTFFPWEVRWQAFLTIVAVAGMAFLASFFNFNGWTSGVWPGLGLLSAAGIGMGATVAGSHFRHASQMLAGRLAASEQRQRALLIDCEETARKLANSETVLLSASGAKSQFLSSISHEIRTPLHLILGSAELLDETQLDPQQREYLAVMRNNGTSLLHLLSNILDLTKAESGRLALEPAEFDLEALIDEAAEAMRVRASIKGLELVTQIAPDTPSRVIGDALRTRQILINLIGNAIKFTEWGEVVVSVGRETGSANPMMLHFTVRDSGIGISSHQLEEIFGSFTQADSSTARRFGGSGLGLAIVRRLADLMGGKAWAESRPEGGSTFHFTARFFATEAPAVDAFGRLPARVLVIDDNPACREAVREMLTRAGASAELVTNGQEALLCARAAAAAGHPFDVILLDSRIPGTDSFAVARQLGRVCCESGKIVMMLTADNLNPQLARLHELENASHVIKPLRRIELLGAITDALRSRERLGGAAAAAVPAPGLANGKASEAAGMEYPRRILLSDDSIDNRMLIKAFFKRLPYEIDEAENGEIALRKFKDSSYDVILMDLQMPVMDGLTATRAIRAYEASSKLAPTPIIALTASSLTEDVQQSLAAGADAHVTKPITKAALIKTVNSATRSAVAAAAPSANAA